MYPPSKYGLQLMVILTWHCGSSVMTLKNIASGESISEKYLSQFSIPIKAAGLVHAEQGTCGGNLSRAPYKINVRQILEFLEGGLTLAKCTHDSRVCHRAGLCAISGVWRKLHFTINDILEKTTLKDLIKEEPENRK